MHAPVTPSDGLTQATPAAPPNVEPYVLLPESFALDLRDSELAVGIYLVVARLYLVHQAPIPLSAADIEAFDDGALRRGAILRALDRLCAGGWLIAEQRRGHKAAYLPAWGRLRGVARPWSMSAEGLGRPRGLRAVRVPRVVLDVCLGRLTPHHRHAALVARYVTRAPISLRDLGIYGLAWAGLPRTTPALTRLGLVSDAGPLPPPSPGALLARISQLPLLDADPAAPSLSPQGLRRAGLLPAPAADPDQPALFFVPPDLIGSMIPPMIQGQIGDLIAPAEEAERPAEAAAGDTAPPAAAPPASAGTPGSEATPGMQAITTTQPAPVPAAEGGGGHRTSPRAPRGRQVPERKGTPAPPAEGTHCAAPAPAAPAPADEPTPAARRLIAAGVRRDVAERLADRTLAQVERVIAQARSRQGVRDIAGWVVSALRALPAEEPQPAAPPPRASDLAILTHPGLSNHDRTRWLARFRSADPMERPAVLGRFHAEHPPQPALQAPLV